ncbi:TIGR02647 family protein [Bowmanella sp. JS7-9]|uniref:TIGR02647 family protein n=1 Tax=Pseudobowmanella zhangzhouensis TaxID=1537679 RepID=A0ABW1XNF3_9ALTE|nr:TIGR02647 family protein [Bowmanella sp. JS7-9]TBX23684.1 DNA-binding protein [Bowmanella sp. JS7-9]
MQLPQHVADELGLLLTFPTDSRLQGLKVHHDADPAMLAACQRLFDKGIIDKPDGGYLTDLGLDLSHHAHLIFNALKEQ